MGAAVQAIGLLNGILKLVLTIVNHEIFHNIHYNHASSVSIGIGSGGRRITGEWVDLDNADGSYPRVAIWDEDALPIARSVAKPNGHVNEADRAQIGLPHELTRPKDSAADAAYVLVHMQESDAVCISYVSLITDTDIRYLFLGDVAVKCQLGANWYYWSPSARKVNNMGYAPRCIWLDQDHTNGISFQGMSIHMPDMVTTEARLRQYNENPASLCRSRPRLGFYTHVPKDDKDWMPAVFWPPLTYNEDLTDRELDRVEWSGYQPLSNARRDLADLKEEEAPPPPPEGKSNPEPKRLVTSHISDHSARELCSDPYSLGPDFVSVEEGVFCDMSKKQVWPLCNIDSADGACFNSTIGAFSGIIGRRDLRTGLEVPEKAYTVFDEWK